MTSPRPTRRRLVVGLLRVGLAAGLLPLLMAPTCGTMAPGMKSFARRSLIIPMDVCYQSMNDDLHRDSNGTGYQPTSCPQAKAQGDVIKAYGLVYQLVRNNIAVYWVIDPAKAATDGVDFSVQFNGGPPAVLYDWAAGAASTATPTAGAKIDYRGGPFVVDGSDYDRALSVLRSYQGTFSTVKVHVANVAFQANVARTMAGGWTAGGAISPKLALLDIGSSDTPCTTRNGQPYCPTAKNSEIVIQGYLTRAGLDFAGAAGTTAAGAHGQIYDRLFMDDFTPSTPGDWTTTRLSQNGYRVLWVPHWEAPGSCSDCPPSASCTCVVKYQPATISGALKTIGAFNAAGNDVFAECAGLGSFEGVTGNTNYSTGDATTRFQTTSAPGLSNINRTVGAVLLRGNFASPLMQIGDYPFIARDGAIQNYRAGAYKAETVRIISDATDNSYDLFTITPSSSSHGAIVYLAGHSYSGTDGAFEVAGSRLVLNTLFNLGGTCQETGIACNTGRLGECSQGVMSCCTASDTQGASPICTTVGQTVCRPIKTPQPEVCDGKDNNCNGLVDETLDAACYDGPATTRGRGICQDGVSSCVQRADGTYGMSACQGQVLPSDEICNGLDDDCDGTVDNVPGTATRLSGACYTGPADSLDPATGSPRGICKAGVATCTSGVWGACQPCPGNAWLDRNNPIYASCQILPMPQDCTEGGPGETVDMTCSGSISCGCPENATQPCYDGAPGTSGFGICHGGLRTCTGGHWGECAGQQTPMPRDCTSPLDNDCNQQLDSGEAGCHTCPPATDPSRVCLVPNVFRVGGAIPATSTCHDGVRSCTEGTGVLGDCQGTIFPSTEICDGRDNNCDGRIDENPDTLCGPGFTCNNGVCIPSSCGVESPCPDGYGCNLTSGKCGLTGCGTGPACSLGQRCQYGACTDPCAGVTCGQGATCSSGFCTGGGCYLSGCPSGQVCQGGLCAADPCAGLACPVGTFCRAGDCVQSCVYVSCASGQVCGPDGFCERDACSGVHCDPGEVCKDGTCQTDACEGKVCGARQVCQDGVCQDSPCNAVSCPVGACSNGQCYPVTTRDSSSAGSSSSGGGCSSGPDASLAALLFLALVPLLRRRAPRAAPAFRGAPAPGRSGGRTALLGLLCLLAAGAQGCKKSSSSVDLSKCTHVCEGEQQCIDLNYDAAHCGTCTTVCDSGQICRDGVCGPSSSVAPRITAVSPSQASHGSITPVPVTLTGERFDAGASLRVISAGGSATYPATVADAGHLSAQLDLSDVPISQLDLRVVNPDHVISNAVAFDVVSLAPNLTGLTPASVNTGSTTTLHLSGTGFSASSTCHVDPKPSGACAPSPTSGTGLPTRDGGSGLLDCDLDATSLQPRTYCVWVVNDGSAASNARQVDVVSSTPGLVSLSPSSGQTNLPVDISITGTGFDVTSVAYFSFGGSSVPVPTTYIDARNLLVSQFLPTQAGDYTVTVHNGSATTPTSLVFKSVPNPPLVSGLNVYPVGQPGSPAYQGDTVTLTFSGSGFTGAGIAVSSVTLVPPTGSPFAATSFSPPTCVSGACTLNAQASLASQPDGLFSAYVTFTVSGAPVTSSTFPFRVLSNVAVLRSASPAGGKQGLVLSTPPDGPIVLTASNLHGAGTTNVILTGPVGSASPVTRTTAAASVTTTTVTVNLDTRSLDTGVYTLAVQNPGATASNQVSFSVMPGQPSLDTIAVGASPPATAACVVQSSTPVTITLAGSNFALPDAQGNGASQVMYSADGTTWNPVPAAINVRAWNQITALFDTRNAVAGVTYSISVWNAPGPMKSAQARTLKVAATSCP